MTKSTVVRGFLLIAAGLVTAAFAPAVSNLGQVPPDPNSEYTLWSDVGPISSAWDIPAVALAALGLGMALGGARSLWLSRDQYPDK